MTAPVPAPTRAEVELLFSGDRHRCREWWCAVWVGIRWWLVFDPPSATTDGRMGR